MNNEKLICEQCHNENKTSTIHVPMGGTTTLLAYSQGYYDETGKYVQNANPNHTTYTYTCSNGHTFIKSY